MNSSRSPSSSSRPTRRRPSVVTAGARQPEPGPAWERLPVTPGSGSRSTDPFSLMGTDQAWCSTASPGEPLPATMSGSPPVTRRTSGADAGSRSRSGARRPRWHKVDPMSVQPTWKGNTLVAVTEKTRPTRPTSPATLNILVEQRLPEGWKVKHGFLIRELVTTWIAFSPKEDDDEPYCRYVQVATDAIDLEEVAPLVGKYFRMLIAGGATSISWGLSSDRELIGPPEQWTTHTLAELRALTNHLA